MDDVDRAIVEVLQRDGRTPFTTIAAQLGLSEGAIRKRVQRLIDAGAMQIVGHRWREDVVLRLGRAVELALPEVTGRRPPG